MKNTFYLLFRAIYLRLIIFSFLLFLPCLSKAFSNDSIYVSLKQFDHDSLKVKHLFSLIDEASSSDTILAYADQAMKISRKGSSYESYLKVAKKVNMILKESRDYSTMLPILEEVKEFAIEKKDSVELGYTNYEIGEMYRKLIKSSKAIPYYEEALNISKQLKDTLMYLKVCPKLGLAYIKMEADEKSMSLLVEGLAIAEKNDNKQGLSSINGNMGLLYYFNKDLEKALNYYTISLQYAEEIQDSISIALQRNHIAQVTAIMGNDDKAAKLLFMDNLEFCKKLNHQRSLATAYADLGEITKHAGEWKDALKSLNKAFEIWESLNNIQGMAGVLVKRGGGWQLQGDYERAILDLQKAEKMIEETDNMEYLRFLYDSIAEIYYKTEDYKNSFGYLMKAYVMKDTLISRNQTQLLADMEGKYQFRQKQDSIQLLKTNELLKDEAILRQKYVSNGAIVFFILAGIIAFLFYRQSQTRKKNNHLLTEKNTKIELLIKEIHHRVKNNLDFLASLLDLQSFTLTNSDAEKAIEKAKKRVETIGLLHQKLTYTEEQPTFIDMPEFLADLVQQSTETTNYDARKTIQLDVDAIKLHVDKALPVGIIVHELITNAFKHFESNQGTPLIRVSLKGTKNYSLIVQDNGSGMAENFDIKQASSFGLRLVEMLSRQLRGNLVIKNDNGTQFLLEFE